MPQVGRSRTGRPKLTLAVRAVLVAMGTLPLATVASAPPIEAVRVEGVVTYDVRLPAPIPVSEAGTSRRLMEVDAGTKGLRDAVVWLEGVRKAAGADRGAADETVVLDQQNYFFVPHVLAVTSGQPVEFRNSDVANHGVKASSLEPR